LELDKNSISKPEVLKNFDGQERCYAILESNFFSKLKQVYQTDELAQEIINGLESTNGHRLIKKKWLMLGGLIVRKEHPDQTYVPNVKRESGNRYY